MKTLILLLTLTLPAWANNPLKKEAKYFKAPALNVQMAFFEKNPEEILVQFSGHVANKAGVGGKVLRLKGIPEGNGAYYQHTIKGKTVKILSMVNGFVGPMYTSHLSGKDEILKEDQTLSQKISTRALWTLYTHKR